MPSFYLFCYCSCLNRYHERHQVNRLFLNDEELIELTEYKQYRKQKEQLIKQGIPFTVSRTGKPVVLKESLLDKKPIELIEPNWS